MKQLVYNFIGTLSYSQDFEGTNDTLCALLSKETIVSMVSLGLISPKNTYCPVQLHQEIS